MRFDYICSSVITIAGRKTLTSIYSDELTKYSYLLNTFIQGEYKLSKKMRLYKDLLFSSSSFSYGEDMNHNALP